MDDSAKLPLDDEPLPTEDEADFTTGILPRQGIFKAIRSGEIVAEEPIPDEQIQPASIDLRLGRVAYRVRTSFLPGAGATVHDKLDQLTMHKFDLTDGAVLERNCVYVVPLLESLKLRARTNAMANPKSSTGRLDIFTRVITDGATEFDRIEDAYKGRLFAEISPRTFSVLVRTGTRLSQLRLRHGSPPATDADMRRLHERSPLVNSDSGDANIASGVAVSVDLSSDKNLGIVGYRAKHHTGVIDVEKVGHYDIDDYWEPIYEKRGRLILDPKDFYILRSKESVSVPPNYAAEMRAYDTFVGEFRVHYAGFFDPGFGYAAAGGGGSRAVLEVRSHDVPFLLEDGQVVGRLIYERLTQPPDQLYGAAIGSNYQSQGLKLSKHFKQD